MTTAFWQRLLAAEASPQKAREIASDLAGFSDAEDRILRIPRWNASERDRMSTALGDGYLQGLEAGIFPVPSEGFPSQMQAEFFPPAIYAWGSTACFQQPCVAIVGTRAASAYGRAAAMKFAEVLSGAGITIISGGALGIDAAAHEGALSTGGSTVAVLAGGVDKIYPAKHRGLFSRIRENGALVSQFAIGSKPDYYKFLIRNRLIAGLAHLILVVEAPERSGALSTATAAAEMGKDVFVVPANVENLNFRGSHALIRDGATLCDHPDQILDTLGVLSLSAPAPSVKHTREAALILDSLKGGMLTADEISDRTGLTSPEVSGELSMLELDGFVLKDGRHFHLKP